MSEESKSNAPATPAPLGEIEHGPSKLEQFMEKNLKMLILLALLVIIGVAAFVIMSQLGEAKNREAGNALLAAESPEDYRKVAKDFPDSGAAASAQLLLAGQLWEEGKKQEAMETLKSLAGNSESVAASQASFTLAGFQLKEGQTEEAKSNFESVLADSEAKYLHPLSLVALGDLANAAGELDLAKEYYQRKLDDYPAYADQNIAVTRLNLVGIDKPAKVPPPPAPDPATDADAGISSSFTNPLPNPNTPTGITPPIQITPAETVETETTPAEEETPSTPEEVPMESNEEASEAEADAATEAEVQETPTFVPPSGEPAGEKED